MTLYVKLVYRTTVLFLLDYEAFTSSFRLKEPEYYAGNERCRKVFVLNIHSYFGEIIFFHKIVGNKPKLRKAPLSPQPYIGKVRFIAGSIQITEHMALDE